MSGQDDERPERERRSWREIDRMRDRSRSSEERRPRSRAAQERASAATKQYVKQLDSMFSTSKGGSEGEQLARDMREAHGTPGLAHACRAYRDAVGIPSDPSLVSLFLDSGDAGLICACLDALRASRGAGAPELPRGLRSQLRILAEGSDDAIAEAAEELLREP